MAEVIRVDYEALTKIASQFQNEAEAIQQLLQMIRGSMTPLQNGGWIGQGSDAFFNEMESDILPAVGRLTDALTQAGGVSRQISEVMQSAEEEAGSPFRNSETGGNGMFVPQGWLKNIGGSPLAPGGNNANDFGIPFNWLDGVAGDMGMGSDSNNWGIPEDWLEGVTDSSNGGGGTPAAPTGGGVGAESAGGGAAGGSGTTSGSPTQPPSAPTGGSGGSQTEPSAEINSPFGQQNVRSGPQTLFKGGQVTTEAQKGRLSYQSLNVGASAPAASAPAPAGSGGTGNAAPAPSGSTGSGAGIGLAVAALTPLLGIMGKTVKDLMSDD